MKKIIYLLIAILLTGVASAAWGEQYSEDFTGDNISCGVSNFTVWDGSSVGACSNHYLESGGNYLSWDVKQLDLPDISGGGNITFTFNVFFEGADGRYMLFALDDDISGTGTADLQLAFNINAQNEIVYYQEIGDLNYSCTHDITPGDFADNTWVSFEISYYSLANTRLYYNYSVGSKECYYTFNSPINADFNYLVIANFNDGVYDTYVDNIKGYWDATTPPVVVPPEITINTDLTSYTNSSDNPFFFTVNVTALNVSITNSWTINIYHNNTLNKTIYTTENLNATSLQLNLTYGNEQLGFNINVTVNNSNSGIPVADNIQRLDIFLDSIQPDKTIVGVAEGSIFYKNISASSFYYNISVTDTNIYAVNITLRQPNGSIITNHFKQNLTNLTNSTYWNYTAINLNDQPTGDNWTLQLQAWDDHNPVDQPHEKYESFTKEGDTYKVTFEAGFLNITDPNLDELELESENNKYKEKFKFNDYSGTMLLSSNTKLNLITNSNHKAHIVSLGLNKYQDLDNPNIHIDSVTKLSDYSYSIAYHLDELELETESIGDLNTLDITYNFTVSESFYVYTFDYETNLTIDEFIAIAYNSTWNYTINTTTGVAIFNLTNSTLNLTVGSTGFITTTFADINFSEGGNYSAYINASNAFKIYVRNELTGLLIQPQIVALEFIGTNTSANYSTDSGIKYVVGLPADDYIIRYSSENYSNAFYYFTLINGSNIQFTIYMLPSSVTDDVTATVIDEFANDVEGAYIHIQRYDIVNNNYITVEILRTNFEGAAVMHVTKNTEFYRFLIYSSDGVLKKSTNPTYIYEDSITFQIQLGGTIAEDFYYLQGITYSLSYNPATNNFRFIYSDAGNIITSGSLYIYNLTSLGETLHNSSTVSAASGTILLLATNVSGRTYRADAYATYGGVEYYLSSLYYNYPVTSEVKDEDQSELFYIAILCILFACLGFWNLNVAILLTPLPLMLGSLIKLIPIPIYVTAPLEILAIIIVYLISRSRNG